MEAPGGAGEPPATGISFVLDPSTILLKASIGSGTLRAASLLWVECWRQPYECRADLQQVPRSQVQVRLSSPC